MFEGQTGEGCCAACARVRFNVAARVRRTACGGDTSNPCARNDLLKNKEARARARGLNGSC